MAELDLDSESILGSTPLPNTSKLTDALRTRADELSQMARDEKDGKLVGNAEVSAAQKAADEAAEKVTAAEKREDELRKAANRATVNRRKLKKQYLAAADAYNKGEITAEEHQEALAAFQAAVDAEKQAKADYVAAQEDTKIARSKAAIASYHTKKEQLSEAAFDEYCSSLSDAEIEGITDAAMQAHLDHAQEAVALSSVPALHLNDQRDHSVYTPSTLTTMVGGEKTEVQGRLMDGGVAITRRGMGDFVILVDPSGDGVYHAVGTAGGKAEAIKKAERIPRFTQVAQVDVATAAQNPLAEQAVKYKQEALVAGVSKCVNTGGPTSATGQDVLDSELAEVPRKLTKDVGDAELAEIGDARRRHGHRLRVQVAETKGEQARAAALAKGLSSDEAKAAYNAAYRSAMGTPTLGGGIIPHFTHKIPPDSIDQSQHLKLTHSGIISFGSETANDYSVIADRKGDLKSWGFTSSSGTIKYSNHIDTSDLNTLTHQHDPFINGTLTGAERSALTYYTGGSYQEVNAAFTGRTENPSPTVKGKVGLLRSAFDKYEKETPNLKPMTIMRGTKVPSGWKGTPQQYLDSVFKPGEKVQIGKVTSATTNTGVAPNWTGHPPYIMVIRTRKGIPVRSISQHPHEDEVIVPPGSDLRCVRVDHSGIDGKPTVYLVAEDLVAEAQDGITNPKKTSTAAKVA